MQNNSEFSDSLVLGIDTGGTYTDAVLMEYYSRRVLASHKSLTTKRDLSIGIEKVIDGIHIDDPSAIKMVSVSTTLATNAIAEGKGKRVALLLIGYDPELVANFKMERRFATPQFYYFQGGHDLYGREKAELDLPAILAQVSKLKGHTDALAVSSYFSPLNPEHENRVYNAVSRICDLPIVLGHQLSTKLGSVERATTAALNASLLAVLARLHHCRAAGHGAPADRRAADGGARGRHADERRVRRAHAGRDDPLRPGGQRHRRPVPLRAGRRVGGGRRRHDHRSGAHRKRPGHGERRGRDGRRIQDLRPGCQPAFDRPGRRQPHHVHPRPTDRGRTRSVCCRCPIWPPIIRRWANG